MSNHPSIYPSLADFDLNFSPFPPGNVFYLSPESQSQNPNSPISYPPQQSPTPTTFHNALSPPPMMMNTHPVPFNNPAMAVVPYGGSNLINNQSGSSSGSDSDSGDETKTKKRKTTRKQISKKQRGNKNRISVGDINLVNLKTGQLVNFKLEDCKLKNSKDISMRELREMVNRYTAKHGLRDGDVNLYIKNAIVELLQRKVKPKRKTRSTKKKTK